MNKYFMNATLLLVLVGEASGTINFFKARTNITAVNSILPIVRRDILPAVLGLVNEGIAKENIKSPGFSVGVGGFSLSLKGRVGRFKVKQNDNNINLVVNTISDRKVQVRILATDLGLSIRELSFSLKGKIKTLLGTISLPGCSFRMVAEARLSSFEVEVDLEIDQNNIVIFKTKKIEIGRPSISLTPSLKFSGLCDVLLGILLFPLLGIFEQTVNFFLPALTSILNQITPVLVNQIAGNVPIYLPLNLNLDGLGLSIKPAISSFSGDGSPATFLEVTGGLAIGASLSTPDWRDGSSLSNEFLEDLVIPDPAVDRLVNIHIGSAGVNSLVEPIWYLVWSTLARDSAAQQSPLCQDVHIASDPCPFPPIIRQAGRTETNVLRLAFLVRGIFRSFTYHLVLLPPRLVFQDSQEIVGTTSAQVVVMGDTLFRGVQLVASVDVTLSVGATIPSYNSATGKFSSFELSDVNTTFNGIEFIGTRRPLRLAERAITGPITSALNAAADTVAPFINTVLGDALDKIPVKIPTINISALSIVLESEFTGAGAVAKSAKNGLGSYLDISSDFTVEATNSFEFGDDNFLCNVYDSSAYELALEDLDEVEDVFLNETLNTTLFNISDGDVTEAAASNTTYFSTEIRNDNGVLVQLFEVRLDSVNGTTTMEHCVDGEWIELPPPPSGPVECENKLGKSCREEDTEASVNVFSNYGQ